MLGAWAIGALRLVGEDGFSTGGGEDVHGAEAGEVRGANVGVIREQEETAWAGPEPVKGGVCLEDGGGVGPEAAIPGAVHPAVDEVYGLAGIEEQG